MPTVIKSFVGVFFFALVVFLGTGILSYQADVSRALSYKQDVIQELQNSNFSPSVMNACIQAGEASSYQVSIAVAAGDGTKKTYTKQNPAANDTEIVSAYVTVKYTSRLPFLGVETANTLRGFAR